MKRGCFLVIGVTTLLLAGCASPEADEVLAEGAIPPSWQIQPENKSSFDIPPKLLSGHAPIYPISQVRERKSGSATIGFIIDTQGKTRDLRVIAADYPFFGSHAILAVQQWQFEPARKNGLPVEVREKVTFDYRIRN